MNPPRDDRPPEAPAPFALSVARALDTPPPSARPGFVRPARPQPDAASLARMIHANDRAALGQAVSLIESTQPRERALGHAVIAALRDALPPSAPPAIRVGVTGVPGAGKSTLIDRLGAHIVSGARRVGVLAVDPSSRVSGGSILGDKTRMPRLAAEPGAFIRPSPSAGTLGGVARTTRDTIALLEAAGFDTILVETVGVGQSETAVAGMTDVFLAIAIPGAGDELQGIKRGLLELVDIVAVNKSDGDNIPRAARAAHDYAAALRITARADLDHPPSVLTCSALTGDGVPELWTALLACWTHRHTTGRLITRRQEQHVGALEQALDERLRELIDNTPAAASALADARRAVASGALDPAVGVDRVIAALTAAVRSAS